MSRGGRRSKKNSYVHNEQCCDVCLNRFTSNNYPFILIQGQVLFNQGFEFKSSSKFLKLCSEDCYNFYCTEIFYSINNNIESILESYPKGNNYKLYNVSDSIVSYFLECMYSKYSSFLGELYDNYSNVVSFRKDYLKGLLMSELLKQNDPDFKLCQIDWVINRLISEKEQEYDEFQSCIETGIEWDEYAQSCEQSNNANRVGEKISHIDGQ